MNVILLCHWSRNGYQVLRSLKASKAKVWLIADDAAKSLESSHGINVIHHYPTLAKAEPDEVCAVINRIHRRFHIDYVIASDLEGLILLNGMKNLRPKTYPMADQETLIRLHDKWEFQELCRDLQIPVPAQCQVWPRSFKISKLLSEVAFPLVVKHPRSFGQRGIAYIHNRRDLEDTLNPSYPYPYAVVQEFIPGQDWGCSVFAENGRIINWATFKCPNYHIAKFEQNGALIRAVERIVDETRFSGVANFDARLDGRDARMKLFECNPRFFMRLSACRLAGLDFLQAGLGLPQPFSLLNGSFYHPRDIFTRAGQRALLTGQWSKKILWQEIKETLCDPMPIIRRKLRKDKMAHQIVELERYG